MINPYENLPISKLEEFKTLYEGARDRQTAALKQKDLTGKARNVIVKEALRIEDRLAQINTALIVAKDPYNK